MQRNRRRGYLRVEYLKSFAMIPTRPAAALLAVVLMAACATADDSALVRPLGPREGTYQLVATLADPGDGSGTCRPAEAERQITIAADSTFTSNEGLCWSRDSAAAEVARFDAAGDVTLEGCFRGPVRIVFVDDGFELYYRCIEGCGEKYRALR